MWVFGYYVIKIKKDKMRKSWNKADEMSLVTGKH